MASGDKVDLFALWRDKVQEEEENKDQDYLPFCVVMIDQFHGQRGCTSLTQMRGWFDVFDALIPKEWTGQKDTQARVVVKSAFEEVLNEQTAVQQRRGWSPSTSFTKQRHPKSRVVEDEVAAAKRDKKAKRIQNQKDINDWWNAFRTYVLCISKITAILRPITKFNQNSMKISENLIQI